MKGGIYIPAVRPILNKKTHSANAQQALCAEVDVVHTTWI